MFNEPSTSKSPVKLPSPLTSNSTDGFVVPPIPTRLPPVITHGIVYSCWFKDVPSISFPFG